MAKTPEILSNEEARRRAELDERLEAAARRALPAFFRNVVELELAAEGRISPDAGEHVADLAVVDGEVVAKIIVEK